MTGLGQLARLRQAGEAIRPGALAVSGVITAVEPGIWRIAGLSRHVRLGDCVRLSGCGASATVIRIDRDSVTVKPFETGGPVGLGERAVVSGPLTLRPDPGWRGRVIDGTGRPIDGKGPLPGLGRARRIDGEPPPALARGRVRQPLRTGVRAIDIFAPLCLGQRIGVFAGSGVGKSTLLAMLARSEGFDAVVIALVGERGREVREFLEETLGNALDRAVMVVATGDESAMIRATAPLTAMTVAEAFRDRGERVLMIVDSVTRYAHALRDVALAGGEPPVARGYPPSVFGNLPRLLERAGPGIGDAGSITGVFSVLVDGDDLHDPVADTIRGTLDGHVVLDRTVGERGRYPAVDLLGSISRLAQQVWSAEQRTLVARARSLIARFEETRDLRLMGGYKVGTDAELDRALAVVPLIEDVLTQRADEPPAADAFRDLAEALQKGLKGDAG